MNADDQEGSVIVKVIVAEGFHLNSQMGGEGQGVAMATVTTRLQRRISEFIVAIP